MTKARTAALTITAAAVALVLAASIPKPRHRDWTPVAESLGDLRTQLKIPGMAAAIAMDGEVVWRQSWGNLNTTTPRDIASVTKTMAAVLALQQVQKGKLGLQDPVPGLTGVEVRHLLSHTSVGRPGESFAYNNDRYGALTGILERNAQVSFPQLLQSRILAPAGMSSTQPAKNSISGVISTVEDLARYAMALDGDQLLNGQEKQSMWTPIGPGLPYALGWFSQIYRGQRVVWHYGQLGGYGTSLIVKVPALEASLIVLSNSSALADTCDLPSGDLTRCPLGLRFLDAGLNDVPRVSRWLSPAKTAPVPQTDSLPAAVQPAAARPVKGTPPAHSGF